MGYNSGRKLRLSIVRGSGPEPNSFCNATSMSSNEYKQLKLQRKYSISKKGESDFYTTSHEMDLVFKEAEDSKVNR